MDNLQTYSDFAIKIAKKAGKILMKYQTREFQIKFKGGDNRNIVTEVDHISEDFIVKSIKKKFPTHCVLSEEGGDCGIKPSNYRWIIDPIDGTTNFAHGFNFFCVSIALEKDGEVIVGVVHAPMMKETFHAIKGKGAFLNNKKIKVSATNSLSSTLIAAGKTKYQKAFIEAQGIRRIGSAALELAYIAAGKLDAFMVSKLYYWDIAAGKLILDEAGGKITNFQGSPVKIEDNAIIELIATNGRIHPQIIEKIKDIQ